MERIREKRNDVKAVNIQNRVELMEDADVLVRSDRNVDAILDGVDVERETLADGGIEENLRRGRKNAREDGRGIERIYLGREEPHAHKTVRRRPRARGKIDRAAEPRLNRNDRFEPAVTRKQKDARQRDEKSLHGRGEWYGMQDRNATTLVSR